MTRLCAIPTLTILTLLGISIFLSTPASAQTMSLREIRYNYKKGRTALKRQQYEKASRLFFDIVENGAESPKHQRRSRYSLALSLFRQNLHLVALNYIIRILRNTKPTSRSGLFVRGMRGLVRISEVVRDETLVVTQLRRIPKLNQKLPPDQDPILFLLSPSNKYKRKKWWPNLYQKLAFLLGRRHFLRGPRGFAYARRFLGLVKSDSPGDIYPKSLYLQAAMASWTGKFKKSIAHFRKILQVPAKASYKKSYQKLKEQAQYGIARTLYAKGRVGQSRHEVNSRKYSKKAYMKLYQESLFEYDKLPKKRKIFQAQVLFETAYTYFMMDKFHFSLGKLLALQSPYYRTGFFPELQILRSLIFFKTCKYEETKQTVENFRKQYMPLQKKLSVLIAKRKQLKWRAQYYKYYLDQKKLLSVNKKTDIPASIIVSIGQEKGLKNYQALMRKVDSELNAIRGKSSSWRESNIGKTLLTRAIALMGSLRKQSGDSIFLALRLLRNEVSSQINQSRIIQLETLQQQKKELLRYAEGGGIEQDEFRYTIVTEQNHIYWPYQGEYWRDEVGYYRQFIQGECKQ